jgi:hypothetical protein
MTGEIIPFPHDPDLDEARIEDLIAEHDGDIGKVAKRLGIGSARLRKFVALSPALTAACEEVFEGAVDEAVSVLFQGLRDEGSFQNRFYAAKEFLRTGAARRRGFGHDASATATLELKDKGGSRTITLRWLEPAKDEPDEPA